MLKINDLSVTVKADGKTVKVLDGLSYDLKKAEVLAVVGESGSGKTLHALALMRLLPPGAQATGEIIFEGRDILKLDKEALRRLRGGKIGLVFQDAAASLNPVFTVKSQLTEALLAHNKLTGEEALAQAIKILKSVGIEEKFLTAYPHQLSGGMRQRVMIAIALCCNPGLLIADEPTTALDVTVQSQILDLLKTLKEQRDMTVIFITHDLALLYDIATRIVVLYGGRKVEEASKKDLFAAPQHPYTKGLLASIVKLGEKPEVLNAIPGVPPLPGEIFPGCNFEPRCPYSMPICKMQDPPLFDLGGRSSRCWLCQGAQNG